ncbi:unnamed protein product, partial [Brassica rapa subsp. narinosa]
KASSLENHPHKSNSIRYFLIIIVNSSLRLADLNYGLFFHLRGEVAQDSLIITKCLYEVKNRRTYISLSYVIEFTFSQIWLLSDLFRKYLNNIEAGWQAHSVNF